MKYVIYGVNRVAKDFLYIFNKIEVVCFIEDFDKIKRDLFENKNVINLSDYKHRDEHIVICDFDNDLREERKIKLEQLGYKYNVDYNYCNDYFGILDDKDAVSLIQSTVIEPTDNYRPCVVWGTGNRAGLLINKIGLNEIAFFIDSFKSEETYFNKEVKHPSEIADWNKYRIIVAVSKADDIYELLESKGLTVYRDYIDSISYLSKLSTLLKQTIFDNKYYDFLCTTMLNHAEIDGEQGNVICCCSAFTSTIIGKISEDSIDAIWNSVIHKILCLSNVNHTYSFCNKNMCPLFYDKEAKDNKADLFSEQYMEMGEQPRNVLVSIDETCNLRCESCRDDLRIAKGEKHEAYLRFSEQITKQILPGCEFLILAGNGEVFFSDVYEKIYASDEMRKVKWLRILTNGTLFNVKKWEAIRDKFKGKIMMTVSIDAATKETYEKLRRGGNFDILVKNMEYASLLRKKGDLSYLRFNFVVQRENYLEMPLFAEWGERLGADEVFFTKILNWRQFSIDEFDNISMMEKDGVTPKKELKEVLMNPIMSHSIVDMGTINYDGRLNNHQNVENYYRWELMRKVPQLFGE